MSRFPLSLIAIIIIMFMALGQWLLILAGGAVLFCLARLPMRMRYGSLSFFGGPLLFFLISILICSVFSGVIIAFFWFLKPICIFLLILICIKILGR